MRTISILISIAIALASPTAMATDSLWCRVKSGTIDGKPVIKRTPFTWSTAHETDEEPTGPIKTSIGTMSRVEGPHYSTKITIDGKPVVEDPRATGGIRFGVVYDFGGAIAIAYLVEAAADSSATPSEVMLLLKKGPTVIEQAVIPGADTNSDMPCSIIDDM